MARIQVLPLTTTTVGPVTATPFVIIIDKVDMGADQELLLPFMLESESMRDRLGAVQVLIVESTLDVENVDPALHAAAAAAVERALSVGA